MCKNVDQRVRTICEATFDGTDLNVSLCVKKVTPDREKTHVRRVKNVTPDPEKCHIPNVINVTRR